MANKPQIFAVDLEGMNGTVLRRRAFGIPPTDEGTIVGDFNNALEAKVALSDEYNIIGDVERTRKVAGQLLRLPQVIAEITRLFDAETRISVVMIYFFDGNGQETARYEVRRPNSTAVLEVHDHEGSALSAAGQWIKKEVGRNTDEAQNSDIAPQKSDFPSRKDEPS